jgi:hypothetical protein
MTSWVVTPCSDVVEYHHFGRVYFIFILKMEAAQASKIIPPYHYTDAAPNFKVKSPEDGGNMVLQNVGILPHH